MGELDTESVCGIPYLHRMYAKEIDGDSEFEILDPSRVVRFEDCLLEPGRLPFKGRLYGEWENPDASDDYVSVEWPNLPKFARRETIELDDHDRERAEKYPECLSVFLVDGNTGEEIHVFYDRYEGIWEPRYEGIVTDTMRVRGYWGSADGETNEEVDWDDSHWVPDWVKERKTWKMGGLR